MLIFRAWMLQEAVRRGHEVLVLCPSDPEAARFAELGVRHIPWTLRRGGGIGNLLSAAMDARRIMRFERPDSTVVYCVQPILALLCAWKMGGRVGKLFPTFTGLGSLWTDVVSPSAKKTLLRYIVERLFGMLLPQAERIFVLNHDDEAQITRWNVPGLHAKVGRTCGEGVDQGYFTMPNAEERSAARGKWGIPSSAFVVGFVGRLLREKGANDFLQICRGLVNRGDAYFLVVGDADPGNPTSLSDNELAALDALPRLRREPWMADVRPAYAAMDVLIFPSRYREGLPMVPQEAMAMGVPVIAYDSVGTREVVPAAQLVPSGEWMELLELIEKSHASFRTCETISRAQVQGEFLDAVLV